MFVLVVLLLHGHVWGSIRVHLLWVRPCFSSSVLYIYRDAHVPFFVLFCFSNKNKNIHNSIIPKNILLISVRPLFPKINSVGQKLLIGMYVCQSVCLAIYLSISLFFEVSSFYTVSLYCNFSLFLCSFLSLSHSFFIDLSLSCHPWPPLSLSLSFLSILTSLALFLSLSLYSSHLIPLTLSLC